MATRLEIQVPVIPNTVIVAGEDLVVCAHRLHLHQKSEAAQPGFCCGESLGRSRQPCNAVYFRQPDHDLGIVIQEARDGGPATTSQARAVEAKCVRHLLKTVTYCSPLIIRQAFLTVHESVHRA